MKRLVGVLGVLAVVVFAVAGCGGGGSSTESVAVAPPVKEVEPANELAKHESRKQERKREERIARENKKFKEDEEKRIAGEEKEREEGEEVLKKKAKQKPQKPRPEQSRPSSEADPIAVEAYEYFEGTDLENWELAYGVCAVTPEKQMAKEFHTEQNWAAIGHAYGKVYSEPFNIAPEQGCMVALKDTEAQREAMFALMEENE